MENKNHKNEEAGKKQSKDLPNDAIIVTGDSFDFWLSEGDNIYDELYGDDRL